MNTKENKKGFSLYMIVVMMSVLLAVILGLATSIIGGINLVVILGDSVKAFYAADTGVERALYNISNNSDCSNFSGSFDGGYIGTYDVTIQYDGECTSGGTVITSTGSYNNARKRIQVSY